MPRGEGVTIKLYGPDKKYGAIRRVGFKAYKWYAVWYEEGRQRQQKTGVGYDPKLTRSKQVEAARQAFYEANRVLPNKCTGAENFLITDVLKLYGEGHIAGKGNKDFPTKAKLLIDYFSGFMVDDLAEDVLRSYVDWRVKNSKGKTQTQTVRGDIEVLQAAINWCVNNRKLKGHTVKLWKPAKAVPRTIWYTREEAAKLIRAARQEPKVRRHLAHFILISLFTGQRSKKTLALQWEPNKQGGYVDLEKGIIDFQPHGKAQNDKKAARMPIPKSLRPFLRLLRKRNKKYVIEYRGNKVGTVLKSYKAAAKRAGLDGSPHTLRHTCISWLLQSGTPAFLVSKYIDLTLDTINRTYAHVGDAELQRLADRI